MDVQSQIDQLKRIEKNLENEIERFDDIMSKLNDIDTVSANEYQSKVSVEQNDLSDAKDYINQAINELERVDLKGLEKLRLQFEG